MNILEQAERTIEKHRLLKRGDAVVVALSGGPDSVALLQVLSGVRKRYQLTLGAVYVNHRIRKAAAKKEEEFCRKLCDRLGVRLHIVREDIPFLASVVKKGVEETARDYRYGVFDSMVRHHGYTKVALGHHRDDQAETILFRLIRGTGPTGLLGMPIQRGRIIRPLLEVSKAEILAYLRSHKLKYCHDVSNDSVVYSRNYIRNKLLPAIRKSMNPTVETALLALADTLGEEERYLEGVVARKSKQCIALAESGRVELNVGEARKLDKWLRRRMLRRCLAMARVENGDKVTVERLDGLLLKGEGAVSVTGGVQATVVKGQMVFHRRIAPFEEPVLVGNDCPITCVGVTLRGRLRSSRGTQPSRRKQSLKVVLDWEKVQPPLWVRNIRPGDRFQPLGLGGTKKVGDYLTDRKVATVYRAEIPVVCDRSGIVWLVGYEIAERVKIDSMTRKVLTLEIVRHKESVRQAV